MSPPPAARATRPITVGVTAGEPAGVGPELCLRLAGRDIAARVVVLGDPHVLEQRARQIGTSVKIFTGTGSGAPKPAGALEVLPMSVDRPVTAGRVDPVNAHHVLALLERAGRGCKEGSFDAVVTAPVHKGVINEAGIPFKGHTEYFADLCGARMPVMMLVAPGIRVALVTTHLPISEVPQAITAKRLEAVIRVLRHDLEERLGIRNARIAVCGLNPHAGEGGHLGREEIEIIEPTIDKLRKRGLHLTGPIPADTAFTPARLADTDVVLAMFHDQGLPVLKHLGFGNAVNVTLGLPIIRTSVDHGTALDIAGTGSVDGGSMMAALEAAVAMATHRRNSEVV